MWHWITMSDNTSKEECPWHVSMTHACLVARGVIEGSKEKEMLELSHTDYYQTIKSNPWSSYLHLCVVSTCSPPLNIWWCLQISPNVSNLFHIWQGSSSLEEILGDCLNRRPNNQPLFFSRLSGWQDLTNCNRIHLQFCSSAIKMMDRFSNGAKYLHLANNLTYPWRIVYWSKKKDSCCWLMLFCTQ